MFEWQNFSHEYVELPNYSKLLEFQISELKPLKPVHLTQRRLHVVRITVPGSSRSTGLFVSIASKPTTSCVWCKTEKHPLYACPRFKSLPCDKMVTILRENSLCMNRHKPGHFSRQCSSLINRCRKCQKPHHTLIHDESKGNIWPEPPLPCLPSEPMIFSNAAAGLVSSTLLMKCQVNRHPSRHRHLRRRIVGTVLLAPLLLLRLSSDRFLPHGLALIQLLAILLPLTKLLSALVMKSSVNSGKLKKTPRTTQDSLLKNVVVQHFSDTHTRTESGWFYHTIAQDPQATRKMHSTSLYGLSTSC